MRRMRQVNRVLLGGVWFGDKDSFPSPKGSRPGGVGFDQRKEDQEPSGSIRGEVPPVPGCPAVEARRFVKGLPKEVKELMDAP